MQHIRLRAKHNDWKSGRGLCDFVLAQREMEKRRFPLV
jgi:hypothetical protein